MDETYIRLKGEWMDLYRAVDKIGKTVDFYLSLKRDVNAAKAFLRRAMKGQRVPTKITLDAYAASHRAVAELKDRGELPNRVIVSSSKYLNNLIEQDHRRVKQRLRPMLGLKSFETAEVVIGGIELAEKIKKGQFKTGSSADARRRCQKSGGPRWLPNRSRSESKRRGWPKLRQLSICTRAVLALSGRFSGRFLPCFGGSDIVSTILTVAQASALGPDHWRKS